MTQQIPTPSGEATIDDQEHEVGLIESILASADKRKNALEPTTFEQGERLAAKMASAGLCPSADEAFIRIQTAMALGIASVIALICVYVIEGKPALAAKLKLALARRSPAVAYIRCVEMSDKKVVFVGKRREDEQDTRVEWTWDQASKITNGSNKDGTPKRLTDKDNWRNYPAHMLTARATSQICDILSPDTGLGIISVEEAADMVRPPNLEIPTDMMRRAEANADKRVGLFAMIANAKDRTGLDAAMAAVRSASDAKDITDAVRVELAAAATARAKELGLGKKTASPTPNGSVPHDPKTGEVLPTPPVTT